MTFLDADDEMLPSRIERQILFLESAPGYDAVIVAQEVVVDAGITPPPWYLARAGGGGSVRLPRELDDGAALGA